jgi:hypothetical protein
MKYVKIINLVILTGCENNNKNNNAPIFSLDKKVKKNN